MTLVSVASLLAVGLIVSGCADMSGIAPQASLRDAPSLGLKTEAAAQPQASVAADWWQGFGDAQLNGLIDQALQSSPSLKLAQARLARAQAVTEVANAATLPQLNGQLDLTRQRYTANGAVPPPLAGSIQESGTAQLNASWELDFFGKNRAALDAALGSVHAAEADAQAARVLLASQVARSYFQLLRLNEQTLVARRTLAQREETLKLVQDRVRAGLDTRLELRQSEGGLPEARLQLESLQEQMTLTRNALAALMGQPNGDVAKNLPALSAINSVASVSSLPADLLGRRADIAAARWRVEASAKDVVNAKMQFYPNINLVAFAGFSSIGLGQLLNTGSQQWGVGPALRLPIFDAGRLRANLRGKTADLDAAVESYNAAVIDAVRDVADQVASSQAIVRQQTQQVAAQEAAEGAYEIAVQRYQAGLGNYLNVLTAETSVLAQRRLAVDLASRALDTQVALIRALGGGYTAQAGTATLPLAAPEKVAASAGSTRATGLFPLNSAAPSH
ncbi:efflux transporter outer membrane subunit [Polaromonas sp. OV174]|uniref:efflux transporter outer membrane subunit n=1 Tax=Polaromonas sp. OV174 TaxID=1855300 RepID=UPI000B81409F|nr:efflux transporter outer membrane subunit [Polaromonas sp. OV174]